MRCNNCNKFASQELCEEPETDLDITGESLTGTVRITQTCADCGQELCEANFDVDETLPFAEGAASSHDDHEQEIVEDLEVTDEGGGRYAPRLLGVKGTITVKCSCGQNRFVSWSDKIAAGQMDECQ